MKNLVFLIKSILAGIMISIGGTVYLSLDNKIVGAFLFAIGLFVIVSNSLNLFTGKIGYVVVNKINYLIEVLITLVGNFIGTALSSFILSYTRIYDSIHLKAKAMCDIKLNDNLLSIFILAVFCGMLMYIAVNGYKTIKDELGKNLVVFLGVAVFILSGFEHSIADMYYFGIAGIYTAKMFLYLLVIILGNSVGAVIFSLSEKFYLKNKDKSL